MSNPSQNLVCSDCLIGDKVLQSWVKADGHIEGCSYCRKNSKTLSVQEIAKKLLEQIKPVCKPRPIRPGVNIYLGTNDVLAEVLNYSGDIGGIYSNCSLIGDLCLAIDAMIAPCKAWKITIAENHGYDVHYSWRSFVGEISYRRRFLFLSSGVAEKKAFGPKHSASEVLEIIGKAVKEMGLVKNVAEGEKICRARVSTNGETFSTKEQLGAPPRKQAKSGRMNPPGIPYFYAATDELTACAEVSAETPEKLSTVYVSTWETRKALEFVDLTKLGELPSFFAQNMRKKRAAHKFLGEFIRDVCAPLMSDDVAQLAYVPGQVVSEYFRTVLLVDGVIFHSTKKEGGECLVVFPYDDDTIHDTLFDEKLKLCPGQTKKHLVGIEPDLIILKSTKPQQDTACPWGISAHR